MDEQERKAKAKSTFWWTYFITIFSVIILSSFLADWLHMKSLSSAFGVPSMVAGVYLGVFVCRKRGLSSEEQKVTLLEPQKVESRDDSDKSNPNFEILLPPMDKATFWSLTTLCLVGMLMGLALGLDKGSLYQHGMAIFMGFGGSILLLILVVNRHQPSLHIRRNSPTFSRYSWLQGPSKTIAWNQIASGQIIESTGLWGQDTSRVVFFNSKRQLITTIWCVSMKPEEKAAFLDYINQRFTPPNRVLD